jgi:hypothetical protein
LADSSKKDKADAQFQKLQRADEGKKAMSEYEAAGAAARANMERLRALRLARDAAGQQDAESVTAAAKKKKPAKGKKAKGTPLSDWLKGQKEDGRN